jgi:5-methylcytosine-specific restriction endonuclease McrA
MKLCCNKDCRAVLPEGRKDRRCALCNRTRERARYKDPAVREYNRARSSSYYASHKQEAADYNTQWCKDNPDKKGDQTRRYREAHPEAVSAQKRAWCRTNAEKVREQHRRRRALKAGCSVGPVDIRLVIEKAGGLCQKCGILIAPHLRHIDHVVPLSKGGPHSQENLQLLCRDCNLKKGAKMP